MVSSILVTSVIHSFYGSRLASERPLALVAACDDQDAPADAALRFAPVGHAIREPVWSSPFVSIAADGTVVIEVAAIGRFLLRSGREITVEVASTAAPIEIEAMLLGPVARAFLCQRGVFQLRASCVDTGKGAMAIAGPPCSGKSTLAAALIRRGAVLMGDGVCAVRLSEKDAPLALQGGTGLALWPDSLAEVCADYDWLPIRSRNTKRLALLQPTELPPRRLTAIVCLETNLAGANTGIRRLSGAVPMRALAAEIVDFHTYCQPADRGAPLLRDALRLAASVPTYKLNRPNDLRQVEETARWTLAAVEEH